MYLLWVFLYSTYSLPHSTWDTRVSPPICECGDTVASSMSGLGGRIYWGSRIEGHPGPFFSIPSHHLRIQSTVPTQTSERRVKGGNGCVWFFYHGLGYQKWTSASYCKESTSINRSTSIWNRATRSWKDYPAFMLPLVIRRGKEDHMEYSTGRLWEYSGMWLFRKITYSIKSRDPVWRTQT